mgnify:FL=1
MANIKFRRGKYQAQIRRKGYPDVYRTFTNQSVAKKWIKATEADMERQLFQPISGLTLNDVLERYQQAVMGCHKNPDSSETYRLQRLKRDLGGVALEHLTPAKISTYRDNRLQSVSGASVKRELVILRSALNTAIKDWGISLPANPVTNVRIPANGANRTRRLEQGEEQKLLSSTGELKLLIIIALETGMRRGEILNIKRSHIDFVRQTLLIPLTKTDTPRTIPLSSKAIAVLREQLRGSENVIPIEETALFSYTARGLSGAFLRLCRRHKLKNLHFHDLRHEATSRFFEKGLNPVEVATITGHKDTRMLMRYTHLRAEDLVRRLG